MKKIIPEIRNHVVGIADELDRIENGVINGTICPTCCREKGNAMAKIEIPKSCDECPVEKMCASKKHNEIYCKIIWEKIISYCTKK